jgi:hypothetical protein
MSDDPTRLSVAGGATALAASPIALMWILLIKLMVGHTH